MDVDVIIIGSGQAGVPLATRLAHAGRRVILVERAQLGGTCINYGCTPTKTMVASARAAHVARTARAPRRAHRRGARRLRGRRRAQERHRRALARRRHAAPRRARASGCASSTAARASSARARSRSPASATAPRRSSSTSACARRCRRSPGSTACRGSTTAASWSCASCRGTSLVLGGGYIGCEFGQMFRRFGAEVDHRRSQRAPALARGPRRLGGARGRVPRRGHRAAPRASTIERVERPPATARSSCATQRRRGARLAPPRRARPPPNTDDLGCDAAGITLDARGYVVVDDRYAPRRAGVFAVGDVTGGPQFTHTSWDDHRLLFDLLLGRSTRGARRSRTIPYVGVHRSAGGARGPERARGARARHRRRGGHHALRRHRARHRDRRDGRPHEDPRSIPATSASSARPSSAPTPASSSTSSSRSCRRALTARAIVDARVRRTRPSPRACSRWS